MKILHVIPSLAPCHGGPSAALPIMERALTAQGVLLEIVTTDDDGPGKRNNKGDGKPREENGVIRRYFRKQTEFYKFSLPLGLWLHRNVRSYDLVHVHAMFSYSCVAACHAARAAGIPYIIRPLGVLNRYGITQRRATLKRLCLNFVDGPLLRDAAAVHFTLPLEQAEAEELGIDFRPIVVPLGIEPQTLPLSTDKRSPYVLYLSRIDPKKNLEALLKAWERCNEAFPDWCLIIAGTGQPTYEKSLRILASSLKSKKSIQWLGNVTGDLKSQILADADVFILPSYSENFGIAAAEAMLAGKSCVFSPNVAIGALAAEQGAAKLTREDADSIATALLNLMACKEQRTELGLKAKYFAEAEFSTHIMGCRLKTVYQNILRL